MKRWGAHKTIGIASAFVALVLAATVAWLLNKPPTADCGAEALADHLVHKIGATKVVVQPWLGLHQVYGVFMVPSRYKHDQKYAVSMSVRGLEREFDVIESFDKRHPDDVVAEPGHDVWHSHVPTRVALWFMINGLFGDLRRPCNWALVFVERSP